MRRMHALLGLLVMSLVALAAAAVIAAAAGPSAMTQSDLTIRHAVWGCHTWSLNGGGAKLAQSVVIRAGHSFTLRNHDNCVQRLVQIAGPSDVLMHSAAGHSDGTVSPYGMPLHVNLLTPGTYEFTTVEGSHNGEEASSTTGFYRQPSVGSDNELTLKVTVLPPLNKFDE